MKRKEIYGAILVLGYLMVFVAIFVASLLVAFGVWHIYPEDAGPPGQRVVSGFLAALCLVLIIWWFQGKLFRKIF